jgi:hypothetical protein
MAGRIPCTCGCGLEVTYATKQNHLNGRGKIALRAEVVLEARSLKRNTQQQQEPTPFLQRGFKKRASSNPDRDVSRKRRKAAQLEENQLPEIAASSQLETDLIEDLLPPVAAGTDRQGRFIERSRGVMEMRWTTSRRDGGYSNGNGKGGDNDDGDEEEEEEEDKDGEKDEDDEGEDEGEENQDKDEDELPFYDSEIPGISNWDLLGEDFEREAAALGLYSSYELPIKLTTL